MDKYRTSERIEEWIKEKLKDKPFQEYHKLKDKVHKMSKNGRASEKLSQVINKRYNYKARRLDKNKVLEALDSKRGETEIRRRPKVEK